MTAAPQRLGQAEFIALIGMLLATIAFSIDAMLPALPQIAAELSPQAPNAAQLIVTSFVLGMGLGTFVTGPLADRFGRKTVIVAGSWLYIAATVFAYFAVSLESMLAARVIMGLAAAAPRVAAVALVRDLYAGRDMARVMSFAMLIFSLVPALAPTLGAAIIALSDWRGIFVAFALFAAVTSTWLMVRQPETLPRDQRRPLKIAPLWAAAQEVLSHPTVRLATLAQTLSMAVLFASISSTQQVFDQTYGEGARFHLWFGGIALLAGSASLLNARIVRRLGMRPIIKATFLVQSLLSLTLILLVSLNLPLRVELWAFAAWTLSVFFQAGLTLGNLNALALEPMGHIAGMAASLVTALATMGAVVIAAPIGLLFDGTALPLAMGTFVCVGLAYLVTRRIRREDD